MLFPVKFNSSEEACKFILGWDGKCSNELLQAIRQTRQHGDRFEQDTVLRCVARMPFEYPRPMDIPIFVGSPVWVIDRDGNALVGMPGMERIEHVDDLRKRIMQNTLGSNLLRQDTHLI